MNDAEILRSIAQNDYMIDGHFLPAGEDLCRIADRLEGLVRRILAEHPGEGAGALIARIRVAEGALSDSKPGLATVQCRCGRYYHATHRTMVRCMRFLRL
jgi:hypothetical protein